MKESDALHELVHSLEKNEKRYFRMYCSGLSARNGRNYVQLFDAIAKQKTFDAAALKKSLKSPALVRNLSAEKNYLFNLILDSLLAYHREQPLQRIRMLTGKAQLLFDKGLTRSSARLLQSAKKLARAYSNKELLLEILMLQTKQVVDPEHAKKLSGFTAEKDQLAHEILNENRYSELLAKVVETSFDITYKRNQAQREKLDQLMQNELLQGENRALSLQARLLFYNIWSFYYYFIKMPGHIGDINRRMLQLFEENPGYTSVNLNDYLSVLSNFASDALSNERPGDARYVIKKLEEFPNVYGGQLSPVVKQNYTHLYLEIVSKVHVWLGEFDKVIALLPELREIVANERVLKSHRRQSIAFSTALALFAHKRYKESMRLLQMVEDINEEGAGSYFYFMQAMFLRFIMHEELGHIDVLEEQAAWLKQYLIRQNKLHRTEEELLAFFSSLPDITSEKERRTRFTEENRRLQELLKDPYEYPLLRTLNFVREWIEAKVEGTDFATVRKRQHPQK